MSYQGMTVERIKAIMEIKLTAATYDEVVGGADGTVLIDFWAEWCGPCRMIAPIIAEVAAEHPEITVCKVNVDEEPELANRFEIKFIPTLAVLRGGRLLDSVSRHMDKAAVLEFLRAAEARA